jgi:carboxylesterase
MTIEYIEGAEPLYISGENRGCLLLHGAGGGTTWDLKEFVNLLHNKTGMTIWLPALKGFGTKPEDLYDVTFDNWLTNADDGVEKLQETCKKVFIVGHSLGGILALLLAAERKDINAVVTWSAPIGVQNRYLSLLPIIAKIPLLRRAIPEKYPTPIPDWLKEQGWIGYDWIPTSLGVLALEGIKRLKKCLSDITCPALIIQGSRDQVLSKDSADKIFNGMNSDSKEKWIIEGADHPIMNELEYKDELFSRTISFLERYS